MKTRYRPFIVRKEGGVLYPPTSWAETPLPQSSLPLALRALFPQDGAYRICRVLRGGTAVRLMPTSPANLFPARYTGTHTHLCATLCAAVAYEYEARKPETIRVSIRYLGRKGHHETNRS